MALKKLNQTRYEKNMLINSTRNNNKTTIVEPIRPAIKKNSQLDPRVGSRENRVTKADAEL